MKKILIRVMKNKIIQLIKILGIGINELVIDINLDCGSFESVEWDKEEDKVYLHIFEDEDIDIAFDFEELSEEDQLKLYQILAIFYN
jgi:hypothetical protein